MRIRIRIAYALIAVTYIATVCSILFGCHPMHKNWQINPDPGSELNGLSCFLSLFDLLPVECHVYSLFLLSLSWCPLMSINLSV